MKKTLTLVRGEDPFPVITIGDVATRTGVKLDTVKHWVQRSWLDTPKPIGYAAAGALYWWPDWLEWLEEHRPAVWMAMLEPAISEKEG